MISASFIVESTSRHGVGHPGGLANNAGAAERTLQMLFSALFALGNGLLPVLVRSTVSDPRFHPKTTRLKSEWRHGAPVLSLFESLLSKGKYMIGSYELLAERKV